MIIGFRTDKRESGHVMYRIALAVLTLLLMTPVDALAYVDPGTGSYVFQLVIAGGLAAIYTVRRYWQSLMTAVRALARGARQPGPPDAPDGVA
jgi:hypothetical protein